MKAKMYKLGKTEFAITKDAEGFKVYKKVRGNWQYIDTCPNLSDAKMCIFDEFAVDKGVMLI